MPVRPTMADLISKVRQMIFDPSGVNQVFQDGDIQDALDEFRDDVRYMLLEIAPSIVNTTSTGNQPSTIYADYYAPVGYQFWESDAVIQGNNVNTGQPWIVLTPAASDWITGHWQFETNVFTSGTVPGQFPPVFITGKTYCRWSVAADLLEFRAATAAASYDITVDGQSLRRSQMIDNWLKMANQYRKKAKPRVAKMVRNDVTFETKAREYRLLDSADTIKGR